MKVAREVLGSAKWGGALESAAKLVKEASYLLVTAGAGMSVDSGLPDYRGKEGLWKAYPPAKDLGVSSFASMASPQWFFEDPSFAWGFYGHRQKLYQETDPHAGYGVVRRWLEEKGDSGFVFTSNVDGAFLKAGVEKNKVLECHGSVHHLQCCHPFACASSRFAEKVHEASKFPPVAIAQDFRAVPSSFPLCPCDHGEDSILRPNVLMFGDSAFVSTRTNVQDMRFRDFASRIRGDVHKGKNPKVVVVDIGSGLAIPTVRLTAEAVAGAARANGTLIRINPHHPQMPSQLPIPLEQKIQLPLPAAKTLLAIDKILREM